MKYVVIIGDGMADRPLRELGGKTPLQAAFTPNMDRLAREGSTGIVSTIPEGYPAGSDVANLSILGYDPQKHYSGRAPLEAASIGVELKDTDVAYRCNLVSLKCNKKRTRAMMQDYSAGHITTGEASRLIQALNDGLKEEGIVFHPGMSYRHLMVWANGELDADCTAPHDITEKNIADYLPQGPGSEVLNSLLLRSVGVLEPHEVNRERMKEGKRAANSIWLWGQGRKPALPLFSDRYGLAGAMVSAVDLTKGLGIYAGLRILDVPGVTGYLDTNYVGKAQYSLEALEELDFVYIHVEAPDEAGHSGNVGDKIKAIEDFDALVVGTVMRGLKGFDEYRVLLMPDHATPIVVRTHTDEPVPFAIFDSRGGAKGVAAAFDEDIAKAEGILKITHGHELMDLFIKGGE
jgi:2,3-bisphosphoglycerate-independent phosphoglycerate mutase